MPASNPRSHLAKHFDSERRIREAIESISQSILTSREAINETREVLATANKMLAWRPSGTQ